MERIVAHAQMQTHDGRWHVEETATRGHGVDDNGCIYMGFKWRDVSIFHLHHSTLISPPMEEDLHIQGMPTFHVRANTGLCNGGQLFITRDATEDLVSDMQRWMFDIEMAVTNHKQQRH